MSTTVIETDVLVIGGGGGAFRAAIGAREGGARTVMVSKGPLARCGATPMAGADFTLDGLSLSKLGFPGEPDKDSPETFFSDIVHQGFFLNNQKLLEQYVKTAPQCLKELLDWGMPVRKSEERAIYTTGIHMVDTLHRQARKVGAELVEDVMILDLAVSGGHVVGALGLEVKTGRFIHFRAPAVVVATGGWHKAFWPNTAMRDLSGDGIAMSHRAGADIGNMEFITFCCNIALTPPRWRGSLATYILTFLGGELINSRGETFLDKYDPFVVQKGWFMEWNKGFLSYASAREVREGNGSPLGGVWYRRGSIPWEKYEADALATFPNWKYKALDLTGMDKLLQENTGIEVGPVVEYFEGGIVVNERLESTLPGLFAAGECTLGPFGANRVCAATTEMLVHGCDAGRHAAVYAKQSGVEAAEAVFAELAERAARPLSKTSDERPARVRRQVQQRAHAVLEPIRRPEELEQFLGFLKEVEAGIGDLAPSSTVRAYNKEWIDILELKNIVHLLQAATRSALFRKESRGVHFREDFPQTNNDEWLKETIIRHSGGEFKITTRAPSTTQITPPAGKIDHLEMWKQMMAAHSDVGGHH
jgi:succinate dehydrogenase/fumarate reductase flavoprotein subunit